MSHGLEPLLKRIAELVKLRWNVSVSFLNDTETNELYNIPFEFLPETKQFFYISKPSSVCIYPIYNFNNLIGAIKIPSDTLTHDDILEISDLAKWLIESSLKLKDELFSTEIMLARLNIEAERVFNYGPFITGNKEHLSILKNYSTKQVH